MATLQVKGMDDQLYEALRARAEADNRSISQEVIMIIRSYLAGAGRDPQAVSRTLLSLVGSWDDDRSAEEIIADIRRARRPSQRFREGRDVLA